MYFISLTIPENRKSRTAMLTPCFHSPVADGSPGLAGSASEGGSGGLPGGLVAVAPRAGGTDLIPGLGTRPHVQQLRAGTAK